VQKNENEHSWFKMYGIKFGPNVIHLFLGSLSIVSADYEYWICL